MYLVHSNFTVSLAKSPTHYVFKLIRIFVEHYLYKLMKEKFCKSIKTEMRTVLRQTHATPPATQVEISSLKM